MKNNDWRASKSSFENDFSLRKKCISCHQWKNLSEFVGVSPGETNVCADCKTQQLQDKFPKFQRRKCKSCGQFKDPSEFIISNSDVCMNCQKLEQIIQNKTRLKKQCKLCNCFKNEFEFTGNSDICTSCQGLNSIDSKNQVHTKMCVCCNELKDKSEFPIPTSGDARICRACLRRYPPISNPEPPPINLSLWLVLIIGFIAVAILL